MNKKNFCIGIILAFLPILLVAQEQEPFKPHGKIVGEVFGDYYYKMSADTGSNLVGKGEFQDEEEKANAFTIRRMYFGYVYQITENLSGKVLLEGTEGEINAEGKRGVNVKNAFLSWDNIFEGSKLTIGAQATPSFSTFADKVWGYRCVEKNILDFRGKGGSNDVGISLTGKILDDGVLSYYFMVGNGTKQKPETNEYKKIYASLTAKLLDKKLLIDGYMDYEPQNDSVNTMTLKALVAFQTDMFTIGVEPFMQNSKDTVKTFGMSVYARGAIIEKKLNAFARFDMYNPDTEVDYAGFNENFITVGIDYTPAKNVNIIPNIWVNTYSGKTSAFKRENDIVARLTFRYKF